MVEKPWELVEAELVSGLCRQYRALPERGSVMDQPVWILRMQRILDLGQGEAISRAPDEETLADLQELF